MTLECASEETSWAPLPEVLDINTEEDLATIQEIIKGAVRKTSRLHAYNNFDAFVSFYKEYRAQTELTLEQFTMNSSVIYDKKNLYCIGLCQQQRKYIVEKEPTLDPHLYLGIGSDYDLGIPNPKEPPSAEVAALFDHVLVVLPFSFKGRRGYMFGDNGYMIDFPVVVMLDGQWPHTGQFHTRNIDGLCECHAQLVNDDYVLWDHTDHKTSGKTVVKKRFTYLGRQFLRLDYLDRRCKVMIFHGYILSGLGGLKAGIFILFGKTKLMFTLSVLKDSADLISVNLPHDFFCSESSYDDHTQDEEKRAALETFSSLCGFGSIENLVKKFRPFSEICKDADFLEETIILYKQYHTRMVEYISQYTQ